MRPVFGPRNRARTKLGELNERFFALMRIAVPAEVPTLIKSVTVAFEEELIRLANLGRAE